LFYTVKTNTMAEENLVSVLTLKKRLRILNKTIDKLDTTIRDNTNLQPLCYNRDKNYNSQKSSLETDRVTLNGIREEFKALVANNEDVTEGELREKIGTAHQTKKGTASDTFRTRIGDNVKTHLSPLFKDGANNNSNGGKGFENNPLALPSSPAEGVQHMEGEEEEEEGPAEGEPGASSPTTTTEEEAQQAPSAADPLVTAPAPQTEEERQPEEEQLVNVAETADEEEGTAEGEAGPSSSPSPGGVGGGDASPLPSSPTTTTEEEAQQEEERQPEAARITKLLVLDTDDDDDDDDDDETNSDTGSFYSAASNVKRKLEDVADTLSEEGTAEEEPGASSPTTPTEEEAQQAPSAADTLVTAPAPQKETFLGRVFKAIVGDTPQQQEVSVEGVEEKKEEDTPRQVVPVAGSVDDDETDQGNAHHAAESVHTAADEEITKNLIQTTNLTLDAPPDDRRPQPKSVSQIGFDPVGSGAFQKVDPVNSLVDKSRYASSQWAWNSNTGNMMSVFYGGEDGVVKPIDLWAQWNRKTHQVSGNALPSRAPIYPSGVTGESSLQGVAKSRMARKRVVRPVSRQNSEHLGKRLFSSVFEKDTTLEPGAGSIAMSQLFPNMHKKSRFW